MRAIAAHAGKSGGERQPESVAVERSESKGQHQSKMTRRPGQQQQQGLASPGLTGMMPPTLWRDPFGLISRSGGFGLADRLLHDLEEDVRSIFGGLQTGQQESEEGGMVAAEDAMERLWAAVDVRETPASYELSTDMPGLTTENVKVTLEDDNILRIAGERRREEETETQGYKRVERSFGTFERRFKLPTSVEPGEIKASLEHGVLRVVVPKKEAEKELPKEVPIQVQGNSGAAKQA
jgi:HSP20 family protein